MVMHAFAGRSCLPSKVQLIYFSATKVSLDFQIPVADHHHFILVGNGILGFICGILISMGGILPAPNFYNGILNLPELTIYY